MVPRPYACPNCDKPHWINALGYYSRYVTDPEDGAVIQILVRRFLCHRCLRTISLLPIFCQPYRLVDIVTFVCFLLGTYTSKATMYWQDLLQAYKKCFVTWLSQLSQAMGWAYGRAPPIDDYQAWVSFLENSFGSLAKSNKILSEKHHITLLGKYNCHAK
jgi:hypothetical protein